jgi:hypothetical protein
VFLDHLVAIQTQQVTPELHNKQEIWKKIQAQGRLQDISDIHVENSRELLELAYVSFAWSRNHKIEHKRTYYKSRKIGFTVFSTVKSDFVKVLDLHVPCFTGRPAGAACDIVVDFQSCLAFVYLQEIKHRNLVAEIQDCKIAWACDMIHQRVLLPKTLHRFGQSILHEVIVPMQSWCC